MHTKKREIYILKSPLGSQDQAEKNGLVSGILYLDYH